MGIGKGSYTDNDIYTFQKPGAPLRGLAGNKFSKPPVLQQDRSNNHFFSKKPKLTAACSTAAARAQYVMR